MKKLRALLICKNKKPYLTRNDLLNENGGFSKHWQLGRKLDRKHLYGDMPILNGKILIECDFEVKEIGVYEHKRYDEFGNWYFQRGHKHNNEYDIAVDFESLLNNSCLNAFELNDYLGGYDGYAIHVNNLNIFDKPKCLDELWVFDKQGLPNKLYNIPTCMKKVEMISFLNTTNYILIPVSSEEMCRIANGEQSVIVRKRVLKEMI